MAIPSLSAVGAYARAAATSQVPGGSSAGAALGVARPAGGAAFADALAEAAGNSMGTMRGAENSGLQAAARQADVLDVVQAVDQAELTLKSVVAVRDRVVTAYQEIMRMPI